MARQATVSSPRRRTGSARARSGAREPRPLGEALASFLRAEGLSVHSDERRALREWARVLGSTWSRRAQAVRFERGVLTVEVSSHAHMHELTQFRGEGFRREANARLAGQAIERVAFKLKR